ncbi:hypothetical protein [Sphingobium indicum]|uniref:hypothetical protein n=1 Tax=Sphingobium indicum TaxID=332055 RepID=UPI0002F3AD34|nr:hypothetical protein [Sphingobium indicum]
MGRIVQGINEITGDDAMTVAALNIVSRFQSLDAVLLRERLADFAANGRTRRRVGKGERLQN